MAVPDPIHDLLHRVAAKEGVEVGELPPLYHAVDPEALATLLASGPDRDAQLHVEFTHLRYRIVIDRTGEITVRPNEE